MRGGHLGVHIGWCCERVCVCVCVFLFAQRVWECCLDQATNSKRHSSASKAPSAAIGQERPCPHAGPVTGRGRRKGSRFCESEVELRR